MLKMSKNIYFQYLNSGGNYSLGEGRGPSPKTLKLRSCVKLSATVRRFFNAVHNIYFQQSIMKIFQVENVSFNLKLFVFQLSPQTTAFLQREVMIWIIRPEQKNRFYITK